MPENGGPDTPWQGFVFRGDVSRHPATACQGHWTKTVYAECADWFKVDD